MHPSTKHDSTGWILGITCPPTLENYSSVPYNVSEAIRRAITNLVCENTTSVLDNKHQLKSHGRTLKGLLNPETQPNTTLGQQSNSSESGVSAGANNTP